VTIQWELRSIQRALKAPKNQRNTFGNYNYRSCEDILEAIKPLLPDNYCVTIGDEVIMIGNRYYVKATATFTDGENSISVSAFAREEENKKGMDGAQVTGAASSYARKYAANGLFLIDDTADADTRDNSKEGEKKSSEPPKQEPPKPISIDDMKNEIAKWFDAKYGPEAEVEFGKMTDGKLKNPLTIKTDANVILAYNKFKELKNA